MCRTNRKRPYPFEEQMDVCLEGETNKQIIGRLKAQFNNDKYYGWSLSKDFRKMTNVKRRMRDKHELHKAITIYGYEELCSKWNCKDAPNYWYF